ncbi:hypothetical protein [Gemmata sp.]|uniref:hypothetical protein n=1 Tax=Gemmata sp. TaxID=1914242 RepID=UPI003F6F8BD8
MSCIEPADSQARPQFFGCSFIRLLVKKTVANDLGPQAFTLLSVIVMTEDARGYSGSVGFYNPQLMPLIGATSEDTLDRVRKKCVEAGWLHYVPGGRRSGPGRYRVTIPAQHAGTDDAPTDESSSAGTLFRTGAEQNTEQTAEQTASKPRNLLPIPSPNPSAADSTSATVAIEPTPTTPKKKSPAPQREKKPRPRDLLFDALAEATGTDPDGQASRIGMVAAALRKFSPPVTPDEVRTLAKRWRNLLPWAKPESHPRLTLTIIQNHIHTLRADGRAPPGDAPQVKRAADNPMLTDDILTRTF